MESEFVSDECVDLAEFNERIGTLSTPQLMALASLITRRQPNWEDELSFVQKQLATRPDVKPN